MQNDMLEKAKAFLASHINDAHDYNEFKAIAETKPGFIRAMWCGDEACENKIKEDTTVTSRCMPFGDQEQISDVCVCCGKRRISSYTGVRHIKRRKYRCA